MSDLLRKENIEDVYPMSDIQLGMVYHSLKEPEAFTYHNQVVYQRRDEDFSPEILARALALMVEKHPILRTGFNMDGFKEPLQVVFKEIPLNLRHHDLSRMNRQEQEVYIRGVAVEDRRTPFNVSTPGSLWRMYTFVLDKKNVYFLWVCHHAITDGWSTASLMTELNQTYLELKSDPHYVPEKLKNTYKQFVLEQRLEKENKKAIEFWRRELADYRRLEFPGNPGMKTLSAQRKFHTRDLGSDVLQQLNHAARKYNMSLKNLCFAAYLYILSMLAYDTDIVAGLVTSNRPVCEDGSKIIGCFLNTVPVRIRIPNPISWVDFIGLVNRKLLELAEYDRLPLREIVNIIGVKNRDQNPIFDTLFNFVDFYVYNQISDSDGIGSGRGDAEEKLAVGGNEVTNTLFNCSVITTGGCFVVSLFYLDSVISDELVENVSGYYRRILDKFVHEPEGIVRKEDLFSPVEQQLLVEDFNRTDAVFPEDKTIHRLFEEQVGKRPDCVAVVGIGHAAYGMEEITGAQHAVPLNGIHLIYRELNNKSDQLACLLKERGVQSNTIVGIMMERCVEMIIGILGILKAGGAYLPIDPDYPQDRINYMLKDSKVKVLLAAPAVQVKVEDKVKEKKEPIEIIDISGDFFSSTSVLTSTLGKVSSANLAYIIYTSGTTGRPKGCMIEHRNVVRLLFNDRFQFDFSYRDVWTMFHSYCFDFSVWEMYGALLYGGELVVIPRTAARDPGIYLKVLRDERVTILNQTPSAFYNLADEEIKNPEANLKLKYIIFGGEALKPAKLKRWKEKYPETKMINMFGITETTVHVTFKEIGDREIELNISNIGGPLPTLYTYIMDSNLQLLPPGVPGELCVGGEGLGRGYLNRPELTGEKFTTNYFKKDERLYRSGDLAKWNKEGDLEYLGRIDNQVKIRGFRVEPGEIESYLRNHEYIRDAVVICKEEESWDKSLCAYIITYREVDVSELREYLLNRLPEYMVPNYFQRIEKIPLTSNGKLDRAALDLYGRTLSMGKEQVDPSSEMEKAIASIWKEVLKVDKVGIYDNFFDMGGDSVKVIKLNNRLNNAFGAKIPVAKMFQFLTIRSFVEYLSREEAKVELSNGEHIRTAVIDRGKQKQQNQRSRRRKVERINV